MMELLSQWFSWCLLGIAWLSMFAGALGTVIPVIPGIAMIFAAAWFIGWYEDFVYFSPLMIVIYGLLAAAASLIDYLGQIWGAKRAGASKEGLLGTTIGTIAGLFCGLAGVFVLPAVGAFIGEVYAARSLRDAGKISFKTWIAMIAVIVIKLAMAFGMIGYAVYARFFTI